MKIIIDCDPGNGIPGANVDDAVAVVFALTHPAIEVQGIWTVFGNTAADEGYSAAQRLLTDLGLGEPDVRCGANAPLSGSSRVWRQRLDGPSGVPEVYSRWGATTAPERDFTPPEDRSADARTLELLRADLLAAGAGITLACLGPLTNIARLLTETPEALSGVDRICLMGGHLAPAEGVDTNFAVDPAAAAIVLHSGIPLTVVPLDVTRTTELTMDRWQQLKKNGRIPDRVATIGKWIEPWLDYSSATRPVNGMWLHDLVVPAALAAPSLVCRERAIVDVAGSPAGKLIHDNSGVEVDLITAVDNSALIQLWATTVL